MLLQQGAECVFGVGKVVEVEAEESGRGGQGGVAPCGEGAAEGGVVEAGCLVEPGSFAVGDGAEVGGAFCGVCAGDVVPGVEDGDALVRDCVGYRSFEEGEAGSFFYRLVSGGAVLFGGVVEVQMHLPVEGVEELRAALEAGQAADAPHGIREELGDTLFMAAKIAQMSGVDPEDALHRACDKFDRRFRAGEEAADKPLPECGEAELLALWNDAKSHDPS